jgi:hypothetical protein
MAADGMRMVWYGMACAWYGMVLKYGMVLQYGMVWYGIGMVWNGMEWHKIEGSTFWHARDVTQ